MESPWLHPRHAAKHTGLSGAPIRHALAHTPLRRRQQRPRPLPRRIRPEVARTLQQRRQPRQRLRRLRYRLLLLVLLLLLLLLPALRQSQVPPTPTPPTPNLLRYRSCASVQRRCHQLQSWPSCRRVGRSGSAPRRSARQIDSGRRGNPCSTLTMPQMRQYLRPRGNRRPQFICNIAPSHLHQRWRRKSEQSRSNAP